MGAARGRPGGRRLLPGRGASGVERSPTPDCPPSWRAAGAHYPLAVGAGGCGRGDPSPTPQRASASWLSVLLGRHDDARGGGSCLGVGRPGLGALPPPTAHPLGELPGLTTHWLWVRGGSGVGIRHQPHSARSFELALHPVGAARGCPGGGATCLGLGRPGSGNLSHPQLPALWAGCRGPLPTGCRCGGLRAWGPITNPTARALSSWLGALWGRQEGARRGRLLPGCGASGVGRSPTPDCPPSGRAAGAHFPLAAGAGGAGVGIRQHPHSARSFELALRAVGAARGPQGGGASCLGVGRPGSGALPPPTARPSGGLPGCCACACPALPGRAGRPPGRVLVRLTFSFGLSCLALRLFGPLQAGVALFVVVVGVFFFFLLLFPLSFSLPPRCVPSCVFSGSGCLGPWRLVPPPLFFSLPPLCAPRCLLLCLSSGRWCPGPWRLVAPPPFFFLVFFCSPPSLLFLAFLAFRLPFASAPPPQFFFFPCPAAFFSAARLLCVFWGVVLCVPCPARSLCCARRLCCFWWLVLLVPGVAAFCWGSAGGSGCPALSFGDVCWLWCPCLVWESLGVLPVVSRSPVLCPVALCCRVVLCCGALSSCFLFFCLLVALVSCCSPLVLGSGPVLGRFCFCALPVRCCAGVPALLLSVRCSLALAGLAGVLCCCLLCLCVCCWAWLSSVVS